MPPAVNDATISPSRAETRTAVVVGALGQDGTLLSRYLRSKGYRVVAVTRQGVLKSDGSVDTLDLLNMSGVEAFIAAILPDEIYFLAAHHHSSDQDAGDLGTLLQQSHETHGLRFLSLLQACAKRSPETRLFYASSALVFGHPESRPQDEATPMRPACAYGVTKLFGMGLCEIFRRDHGLFCSAGILFNHESPLRQQQFVSRKISKAVIAIKRGIQTELVLGSLDTEIDWSAAEDFVRAMPAVLALDAPRDFVFASGKLHSLREFCAIAFSTVGLDFRNHVKVAEALVVRKPRTIPLHGNPARLMQATGWRPEINFEQLVSGLVQAEMDRTR
nr:GDP-mannose 4,6-dehydratase [Bradyrhizobium lablabi]